MTKFNPAFGPLVELGNDIIGHKRNLGGPTDKLVFSGAGLGRDQRKDCSAVWRRDRYPAFTRLNPRVEGHMESELIHVESQTSILISNKNIDCVNPKKLLHNRVGTPWAGAVPPQRTFFAEPPTPST